MQFYTASGLPSSVSTQDVSAPSISSGLLSGQYSSTLGDQAVPLVESARLSVLNSQSFLIATGSQEVASTQEFDLIEQSLMRWCSAGRRVSEV